MVKEQDNTHDTTHTMLCITIDKNFWYHGTNSYIWNQKSDFMSNKSFSLNNFYLVMLFMKINNVAAS